MLDLDENGNPHVSNDGYSQMCPRCGSWLPTPKAYNDFRGRMNTSHACYCGATKTKDPIEAGDAK
jgi:hypothetical protein